MARTANTEGTVRLTLRLPTDTAERARYWASRDGDGVTLNDFVAFAVENEISRLSGDYAGSDDLFLGRLNQLAESNVSLTNSVDALSTMVATMSSTIIGLASGDSKLTVSPEDGELTTHQAGAGLGDDEDGEQ